MRTIKFRGKRIDNGEWVYGDLCTKDIHHGVSILTDGVVRNAVDPATIGQFTGLLEKNSREIYEGDIIQLPYFFKLRQAIVNYYHGGVFLSIIGDNIHIGMAVYHIPEDQEIIGNIHDTPELLNTK